MKINYQASIISIFLLLAISLHVSADVKDWNLEKQQVLRKRGQYYDLAAQDNYLYMACKRGIEIYRIDDPNTPELVGEMLTDGLANGIAIHGDYAYVGDIYGFNIWDVSDPENPEKLGGFHRTGTEGYHERLLYKDGFVYVAAYSDGLIIIDVSDPLSPFIVAKEDTPGFSWDLALTDSAAYMMDFFSMEIIDTSRIYEPISMLSFGAMFASGIVIQNDIAYLAFIDGLGVLDISSPFNPQILSNIGPTGGGVAESIAMKDHYVFVAHQSYVEVYDVTIPADPLQVSFFNPPGHPRKVLVHNDHLYTILDDSGFHVTDITDPENPIPGIHVNPSVWGSREDVVVNEQYLYLCDWNRGLVIYDLSDPEDISEVATYSTPGNLNEISIVDQTAYLSCYTELLILDITDPADPILLGRYKTTGNPWSVVVRDNLAYLCDVYSYQILDVSDPADIKRLGMKVMSQEGDCFRSQISGNYAYLAHGWGGLKILDISNPTDIKQIKKWPEDSNPNYSTVILKDSILYTLSTSSGVDFLDISDPLSPVKVSGIHIEDMTIADFCIEGDLIFLAGTNQGILGYDISEMTAPKPIAMARTPGEAVGIDSDGQRLYVADDFDLVVFKETMFNPDHTTPQCKIVTPESDSLIDGKIAVISGTAQDPESGIKWVEISVDDGLTWRRAMGQEIWSYRLMGVDPGIIKISARAVNWADLVSAPKSLSFYFNVARPVIWMAGFDNSDVQGNGNIQFTVSAIVSDPYATNYFKEIEVIINGIYTGKMLEFKSESSGFLYYSSVVENEFESEGTVVISLEARDHYNNTAAQWPLVPSRP